MTQRPVARCRVFYQPFNPGQLCFFQALDVDLHVVCEAMWEDESMPNVTNASDHSKLHGSDKTFGFHHYQYILCEQN